MTITEFLLARIAEDEKEPWELLPYSCEPGCCAPAGFVGHRCLICGQESFGGTCEAITEICREHAENIHQRSRVLAECEAKRRIVEYAITEDCQDDGMAIALRALASVYADHPDFDPAWAL